MVPRGILGTWDMPETYREIIVVDANAYYDPEGYNCPSILASTSRIYFRLLEFGALTSRAQHSPPYKKRAPPDACIYSATQPLLWTT